MSEVLKHADGRVELTAPEELVSSPLYNHDLAPVAIKARTWSTWDYSALWISMAHCIPTYMFAAAMITSGLAWWQALGIILIGNLIVLAPILLNSHPGTKYGIPFPVFARAAYGTTGANLPALMRALVACGWFGINAWIGGAALQTLFTSLWPGWHALLGTSMPSWSIDMTTRQIVPFPNTQWIAFLVFWGLNVLVYWAIDRAGGLGDILKRSSYTGTVPFHSVAIPALTGTIAFWSTLSLNMPDFTRFGRSQREQMIGQAIALPTTMTVFAAMGITITSATAIIYGKPLWDPIVLAGKFESRIVVAIAMFTVVVATLAVNIAANTVSPANDFANAFPKRIDFKRGGLITGVVGILVMPWQLLANPGRYFNWLNGYGAALASIAGVLIVDYWLIRKKELDLPSLYTVGGAYTYKKGWNVKAVLATVVGFTIALLGAFWSPMAPIYDWSCFVGFGLSGGLYWLLMRRS
jgi:NCS1 family nucleobase:cation symporter-1